MLLYHFLPGEERQREKEEFSGEDAWLPTSYFHDLNRPRGKMSLSWRYNRISGNALLCSRLGVGLPVVEAADVGAHNLVFGGEELRVEQAVDAVVQQRLVVDGRVQRLGTPRASGTST